MFLMFKVLTLLSNLKTLCLEIRVALKIDMHYTVYFFSYRIKRNFRKDYLHIYWLVDSGDYLRSFYH